MPSARNVLHVYSGNLFGGVERMLISLAALNDSECQAHFALCFEGRLSQSLCANAAEVEFLCPVRLRNPLSALRARRTLARLLRARSFDAIVCHSVWVYCIFAPVIVGARHAPILFLHDIPEPRTPLYWWAWRSRPALCIANSKATAAPLAQLPEVPVRIVHPLVTPPAPRDPKAIQELRSRYGANPGDVVILQASRFDSWKGHRNLLRALGTMRDVPGWHCWIAGAPQRTEEVTYGEELIQLIATLRLTDRVSLIGHRDDMETVLAAADVYCQPNETPEPYGMVFVEALYAGKPVVGRALGGALEIVTSECGILCPPGTEALSNALKRLVASPELRHRMSEFGPARAAALSGPIPFCTQFQAAIDSVTL